MPARFKLIAALLLVIIVGLITWFFYFFPFGTKKIEVEEEVRQAVNFVAVWHKSDKYYYVDENGRLVLEVNPLDVNSKNYSLIESETSDVGEKTGGERERIAYIIKLFNEFKDNKYGLEAERFKIDNETDTVKMAVKNGPTVYFNIKEEMAAQIAKLVALKDEKLKDDFNKKTYIDLRYQDRVYYR